MRVVFLVEEAGASPSRFYLHLVEGLTEKGVTCEFWNLAESEGLRRTLSGTEARLEEFRLKGRYWLSLPALTRLMKGLSREADTVIHAMEFIPGAWGGVARAFLPPWRRPPLIYGRHHSESANGRVRILDGAAVALSDVTIAVSDQAARQATVEVPFGKDRIRRIHNGIETEMGTAAGSDEGERIPEKTPGVWRLTLVGRFRPEKGHAVALRALTLLHQRGIRAELVIAGAGPLEGETKERVRRRDLTGHVHFTGWVENIGELLRSTDILLVPSLTEPFGLVAIEGLSVGIPVVASGVGGLPEILGPMGTLVLPGSPTALAGKVQDLIRNPGVMAELGAKGRERFRTHFSMARMVGDYIELYQDVLSR